MSDTPPDDYQSRTRQRLRDVVADAASQPPLLTPIAMREIGPNAVADLQVRWRCHPRLPHPDELEQVILEHLYRHGRTRFRNLVHVLEGPEWSGRTIQRRLRRLVKFGVIVNHREPPSGYDLEPQLRAQADACPLPPDAA